MSNEQVYRATIPVLVDGKENAELTAMVSAETTRLVNEATAAERKATVERAKAAVGALEGACHDGEGLGCDSYPCEVNVERAAVLAILDAEAAR